MDRLYADIAITNLLETSLSPYQAKALADTGALHLCIPRHIAYQLKLKELEQREVTFAARI